jgi:hypothetical protein
MPSKKEMIEYRRNKIRNWILYYVILFILSIIVSSILKNIQYSNILHLIYPPSRRLQIYCELSNCIYSWKFVSLMYIQHLIIFLIMNLIVAIMALKIKDKKQMKFTFLVLVFLSYLIISHYLNVSFNFEKISVYSNNISNNYFSILSIILPAILFNATASMFLIIFINGNHSDQ